MRREDVSWLWCEHHNASTPYATDSCWFAIAKDALRKTATPCRLVEFDTLARAWAVERGWVEPKACRECEGKWWCSEDGLPKDRPCVREHEDVCVDCGPCPSCGGTGRDDQIKRLADFIMDEIPGEPSRSEGAVDTAIRWMRAALEGETDV